MLPLCPICMKSIMRTRDEIDRLAREYRLNPVEIINLTERELHVNLIRKAALLCGHLFHESCLVILFKSQSEQNQRSSCPVCQTVCQVDDAEAEAQVRPRMVPERREDEPNLEAPQRRHAEWLLPKQIKIQE